MYINRTIKKYVPYFILDYLRIIFLNLYYRKVFVESARVSLGSDFEDNVTIGRNCIVGRGVSIGKHTYLQEGVEINNTKIGRYCSISRNVIIGPYQHPLVNVSTSPKLYRNVLKSDFYDDKPKITIIGNDVWLGTSCVVVGGTKVGDGAVVAANAVVTKDVPDWAIVAGVPAKIIKYRFDEAKIDYLRKMKWWNMTEQELLIHKNFFENI